MSRVTHILIASLGLLPSVLHAAEHAGLPLPGRMVDAPTGIQVTPGRGIYDQRVEVQATAPAGTLLFYSTNGTLPRPEDGQLWPGKLLLTNTTVLRWIGLGDRQPAGPAVTHTFLFPRSVLRQDGAGFPAAWGLTNGVPVRADYGIDPEIANDPKYRDLLLPALRSLPSVSLVTDPSALFDSKTGIYANPMESGADWERPVSFEILYPDGRASFQIQCGIRIQGGWNRRPEESPKHAFRLVFHSRYGAGKCRDPLFSGAGATEFDTLILRAGCNNTWLHWNGEERHRGDYLRDQWMRETLQAMGHPSARGLFVHLYLNGLYWGLYNLTERPSAPFAAAHFGGRAKDYDSRNGNHVLEGPRDAWDDLFRLANAGVASPAAWEEISSRMDVPQFIDYILANLYGANGDWDRSSNWYAARRRKPPGKFFFLAWDAERILESIDANAIATDDDGSPMRLFHRLRQNADFRAQFSERAHRHLGEGGALSAEVAGARFQALSQRIDLAIVAESARWGDYRRDVHRYKAGPYELYTRDDHWRPEIERLLRDYFPRRSHVLREQLRPEGLFQD